MKNLLLATITCLGFLASFSQSQPAFRNSQLPLEARVQDLLKQLTIEEKISLLGYRSREVSRLNIPAYNWWNEALHGVARAGKATIFPQAIGMAASFNDVLLNEAATIISTEARAKYNLAVKQDRRLQYMGLTFWSPNINIFRDPRWGRGQETYGEDPYLTATMGTAFIKGIQGKDKRYLKASACAKHFAVHSGPEAGRHSFDAIVDEKDLRETYLYAFKKLVDGGVESIMCAYNRVNGEPCCTGPTLLQTILRQEWKFKGHVVTDCWALDDIYRRHKVLPNSVAVAAAAIKAGVNLDCSNLLQDDVMKAIEQKLLAESEVDHFRNAPRFIDALGPLGNGLHHRDLVDFLKGAGQVFIDRTRPAERDDRAAIDQRVGETGRQVHGAGAGSPHAQARLVQNPRIRMGAHRRRLLVSHVDAADAFFHSARQNAIDRPAHDEEEILDADAVQRFGDQFIAGYVCHEMNS